MTFKMWMDNLWNIHTVEYDSAIKRSELSRHEEAWKNFKCILLNKLSQSEKATYCTFEPYDFWKKENNEDSRRSVVARDTWGKKDGWLGEVQGIFRAVKLLCMILFYFQKWYIFPDLVNKCWLKELTF